MATIETRQARQTVFVDTFTDGLLGPDVPMLGPVADGGHIVVNTTPGCWGPMITPSIRGGHEVMQAGGRRRAPRSATRSRSASATSRSRRSPPRPATTRRWRAASTATRTARRCAPSAAPSGPRRASRASARRRSAARTAAPTRRRSRSPTATRSRSTPTHTVGVTVDQADRRADRERRGAAWPRCPTTRSRTRSSLFAPHDIVGMATRLRPFMGQLGTSPSITIPDSHNAGDFGSFLVGAPHRFALTRGRADPAQDRRPHGHRRGPPRRDPRLPGQGRRRRRLPRRHARAAGRRRDRRPHLRRLRHGHARGRGDQGPRHRRPGPVPGRRGPALPGPAADRGGARARARARPSPRRSRRSRRPRRSRSSAPGRT